MLHYNLNLVDHRVDRNKLAHIEISYDGQIILSIDTQDGSLLNDVNVTKTVNIPKNGSYILEVQADRNANYCVSELG